MNTTAPSPKLRPSASAAAPPSAVAVPRPKIFLPPSYWISAEDAASDKKNLVRVQQHAASVITGPFILMLAVLIILVNIALLQLFRGHQRLFVPAPQKLVQEESPTPSFTTFAGSGAPTPPYVITEQADISPLLVEAPRPEEP